MLQEQIKQYDSDWLYYFCSWQISENISQYVKYIYILYSALFELVNFPTEKERRDWQVGSEVVMIWCKWVLVCYCK